MAAAVGLVPGSAQAEPDIEDVQARVDRLYHEADIQSERVILRIRPSGTLTIHRGGRDR